MGKRHSRPHSPLRFFQPAGCQDPAAKEAKRYGLREQEWEDPGEMEQHFPINRNDSYRFDSFLRTPSIREIWVEPDGPIRVGKMDHFQRLSPEYSGGDSLQTGSPYGLFRCLLSNSQGAGERQETGSPYGLF